MNHQLLSRLFLSLLLAATLMFAACEDEPEDVNPDNNPQDTIQNDTTGSDTTDNNPVESQARATAVQKYNTIYLASAVSDLGWTGDESTCDAGTLPQSVHDKVLQRINYYRDLTGLQPVSGFRSDWNQKCQEAALMMQANGALDHSPPASWNCYTDGGDEAAGKANLSWGFPTFHSTRALDGQMEDRGSSNKPVGHRRWILYSRANEMGHGSVDQSMVLWVIGGAAQPSSVPEFIAWPPKGYVPKQHVWNRWSFGVPGANFKNASVEMSGPDGNVSLDIVHEGSSNFGDRTMVWEPTGINASSVSADVSYSVQISGVMVDGVEQEYNYTVTIIDPETVID